VLDVVTIAPDSEYSLAVESIWPKMHRHPDSGDDPHMRSNNRTDRRSGAWHVVSVKPEKARRRWDNRDVRWKARGNGRIGAPRRRLDATEPSEFLLV
jgi:hypothetical protein